MQLNLIKNILPDNLTSDLSVLCIGLIVPVPFIYINYAAQVSEMQNPFFFFFFQIV